MKQTKAKKNKKRHKPTYKPEENIIEILDDSG